MRRIVIGAAMGVLLFAACDNQTDPSPPPTTEEALTTTTETATPAPPPVEDETEATTEPAPEAAPVTGEEPDTEAATTEEPDAEDGPPEMPEEANEQTEAGAEAFIRYYIAALDYVYRGGDPTQVLEVSGSDCQSCQGLIENVPENPASEQTFQHLDSAAEVIGENLARVESEVEVLRGSGEGEGVLVFDLTVDSNRWIVDAIRVQDRP